MQSTWSPRLLQAQHQDLFLPFHSHQVSQTNSFSILCLPSFPFSLFLIVSHSLSFSPHQASRSSLRHIFIADLWNRLPPFLIFERFMMTHFAINQISHWTDVIWNASLFQTFFLIYFPLPFLRQNFQNSQFDNLYRSSQHRPSSPDHVMINTEQF